MAEERYQFQRQQSQIECQRKKSIERPSRRDSGHNSIEAQNSYADEASLNKFSDYKARGQEKLKGLPLLRSRIIGLLIKRVIYTSRRWSLFLIVVCTSVLFLNQHNFLSTSSSLSLVYQILLQGLIPMLMAILSQLIINYKILESLNKNDSSDYDYHPH